MTEKEILDDKPTAPPRRLWDSWLSKKGFWIFTTVKDPSDPTVQLEHDPANDRWIRT